MVQLTHASAAYGCVIRLNRSEVCVAGHGSSESVDVRGVDEAKFEHVPCAPEGKKSAPWDEESLASLVEGHRGD